MIDPQPVAVTTPNPAPAAEPAAGAPKGKETFAQAFERHQAKLGGAEPEAAESEPAEADGPAEPKPKRTTVEVEKPEPEGDKVSIAERAAFREAKRKAYEQIQAKEAELMQRIAQREQEIQEKVSKAEAVFKAFEENDPNALAKALGQESWDKLQENYIARLADPNYRELQEVKRRLEEREKAEHETKAQAEQRVREERRQEAIRAHVAGLATSMQQSKEPLLATLHEDANFVQAIFAIQRDHYDGESTVTPEQALDLVPKGGTMTLRAQLQAIRDRLNKAFGGAPAPAQAQAAPAKPKAPKTATAAPSAPAPSAPPVPVVQGSFHRDPGFREKFRSRMAEAFAADEAARPKRA